MKKLGRILICVFLITALCVSFAACNKNLKEVAGTYELDEVSGYVINNGQRIDISNDSYEYFTLTLDKKGNATVKSKGAGTTVTVEASGEYTYKDGKISLTTTQGGLSVTEIYDYADGYITYTIDNPSVGSFNIKFKRV